MSNIPARLIAFVAACLACGAAAAEVPRVVTDVAPVQSLVARAMEGLGEPAMLVQPGTSPHSYTLRPSDAQALQQADLVVWIGPTLTPWLARPIASLAEQAEILPLLEQEGTIRLPLRAQEDFLAQDQGEEPAGHDHGTFDPHAWLDPENGKRWLTVIAEALQRLDPENAETYAANAEAGRAEIDAATAETAQALQPVRGLRYIVFHDAFHYFEDRFDMPAAGAVALSDATDPGPARLQALKQEVADLDVTCALAEPQFDPGLLESVIEGSGARIRLIDPLASRIEPGPDLYPQMLRSLGAELAACAEEGA
ncbi:zinc ABC transporter substrate-binding protein [Pseudoroseicyclus aestuarii]|uniref:High-affinity zinc uptake system protein ZnuA n=1 Tax=Pseudoroseicyclus aestuarii TaxID=1795041 RepID=A0A318SS86_9RHOB|nr:zinc ABC transporter substrate-binding protein [Pseudoroseicyclus aestuarii]PYE84402.1 zinc transport system substrate-binding protein [Pseudoroseicyclus aestuarii]